MEEYKELSRGEKGDRRLPHPEISDLLRKYGDEGLGEDGEFFVIRRKDGSETRFHKWKEIPHVAEDKTIQRIPIETFIRTRLAEARKD